MQAVRGPKLVIDMAIAVERLLTALDDAQRRRACFAFDEDGDGNGDGDDRQSESESEKSESG